MAETRRVETGALVKLYSSCSSPSNAVNARILSAFYFPQAYSTIFTSQFGLMKSTTITFAPCLESDNDCIVVRHGSATKSNSSSMQDQYGAEFCKYYIANGSAGCESPVKIELTRPTGGLLSLVSKYQQPKRGKRGQPGQRTLRKRNKGRLTRLQA